MFLATHAVAGALIGRAAPNPLFAFVGGFISHFLMDMIPHGDSNLYKSYRNKERVNHALGYVTIDAIVTAYVILGIREARQFDDGMNVTFGIIGALLPDLIIGFYNLLKPKWLDWFHELHLFFHNYIVNRKSDLAFPIGVTMQVILLLLLQTRI